MLSKEDKKELRGDLFRHLDGIVTAPTAFALHNKGVTNYLIEHGACEVDDLAKHFNANEGNLNVALRVLASQGWLEYNIDNENNTVTYSTNPKSQMAFSLFHVYEECVDLMKISGKFHPRKFEKEPFQVMSKLFRNYLNSMGMDKSIDKSGSEIQEQVLKHIEGVLVGPTAVALGMGGMFHNYFMQTSFKAEEFHEDFESFETLLFHFSEIGWFKKNESTYSFTDKGLFFAKRASAYGVTVSYIPNFRYLDELIFGDPNVLWNAPEGSPELHVDREMNVWGSGGAHATYFKKIDEIIISIFNKPINEQPKGIVDMGCGNGAFLEHLFQVIDQRTLRGEMLDEHPLFLVGADFNQAALKVSRANLIKADIWAKVIWGDIGRPDILAEDLKRDYDISLGDLLNVRTFLDHNRVWEAPEGTRTETSASSGAFAYRGQRISNNDVEQGLLEHLKKWTPYVERFGLLMIELHTIAPHLAAANLGRTAATAYDATHGFSDQYIVEVDVFNKMAKEAGLFPVEKFFHKFPNSELATVSINLLRGK
ncbi:MAG: class I SAM-dependent methyltransferase [Flavobacteriales bacterium]|nr:class I SAM-dependent methyltransferase [Flavobacteriales bacterium]